MLYCLGNFDNKNSLYEFSKDVNFFLNISSLGWLSPLMGDPWIPSVEHWLWIAWQGGTKVENGMKVHLELPLK
jgi:hypothetical protein